MSRKLSTIFVVEWLIFSPTDSHELLPYTCYFPASAATFLLIDFTNDFQNWTLDENYDAEKIKWFFSFHFINQNYVSHFHSQQANQLCQQL